MVGIVEVRDGVEAAVRCNGGWGAEVRRACVASRNSALGIGDRYYGGVEAWFYVVELFEIAEAVEARIAPEDGGDEGGRCDAITISGERGQSIKL